MPNTQGVEADSYSRLLVINRQAFSDAHYEDDVFWMLERQAAALGQLTLRRVRHRS